MADSTIRELDVVLDRLERSPVNLLRVELRTFLDLLEADHEFHTVLSDIIDTNQALLGNKVANVVNSAESSPWKGLEFADSPALRAAVGYRACQVLLEAHPDDAAEFSNQAIKLGLNYAAHYEPLTEPSYYPAAIRMLSAIFLRPVVSYLRGAMETEHRILLLLSRYRQRSEWFIEPAEIQDMVEAGGQLERRLKKDLLRYLLDNGVEFSIESEIPAGHAEVDVLAYFPDGRALPVEVKVYDAVNRGATYVSNGLAQAAAYGSSFNAPNAYYLVLNVANNQFIRLPGVQVGHGVTRTSVVNTIVYSVVADLNITLPSSQRANLLVTEIPPPQTT